MTIKLSKPSKMPCRSWSLQAIDTCPGSKDSNGDLVPACAGCYATTGNYRFPNVKNPRLHNQTDWKREDWVSDMVKELDNDRYFRWFDSGDVYDLRLLLKIEEVIKLTPHCRHWLPTRMHKFDKFRKVFNRLNQRKNVVVRYSSDSVTGDLVKGRFTSTIIPEPAELTTATQCNAYSNGGKCGDCRACWDRSVHTIAYVAHGVKMKKVVNIQLAR